LSAYDDIKQEGLAGAADAATRGAFQGIKLANELSALGINNSNLQLIGHSDGSAVVGETAFVLAQKGSPVERVTTLDAPNLNLWQIPQADLLIMGFQLSTSALFTGVNAMRYLRPETASQMEVYYSDDRLSFGFGMPLITSATNVFNGQLYPGAVMGPSSDPQNCDHLRILNWYHDVPQRLPGSDEFVAGINWCILVSGANSWVAGNYTEQGYNSKVFGTASLNQQKANSLVKLTVDDFQDATNWFGQHASIFLRDAGNAVAKLASGSDGYLYRDVFIPSSALYFSYDLMVETAAPDDFLTVSLGDAVIDYEPLNVVDGDFRTIDPIYIGDYAGQTNTLLFMLNHVGTGTPSVLLDNVTFSAVPEPTTLCFLCAAAMVILFRRKSVRA
jgi:hypothetical protein